jgi:hypothetical protein
MQGFPHMPIQHARHTGGFTQVDNDLLNEHRLTPKARFVAVYLLSKPAHWTYSADSLAAELGVGRRQVLSALQELEALGYHSTKTTRSADGVIRSVNTFTEVPFRDSGSTAVPFRDSGEQSTAVRLCDSGDAPLVLVSPEYRFATPLVIPSLKASIDVQDTKTSTDSKSVESVPDSVESSCVLKTVREHGRSRNVTPVIPTRQSRREETALVRADVLEVWSYWLETFGWSYELGRMDIDLLEDVLGKALPGGNLRRMEAFDDPGYVVGPITWAKQVIKGAWLSGRRSTYLTQLDFLFQEFNAPRFVQAFLDSDEPRFPERDELVEDLVPVKPSIHIRPSKLAPEDALARMTRRFAERRSAASSGPSSPVHTVAMTS